MLRILLQPIRRVFIIAPAFRTRKAAVLMLAKVSSAALVGLDAHLVDVEVDIAGGLPQFSIVGLLDATVKESRDRVRSALKNSGFHFPAKRIAVNLAPVGLKKEGPGLDLAIAIGILVTEEVIPQAGLDHRVLIGELSLDGQVKPIAGALLRAHLPQGIRLGASVRKWSRGCVGQRRPRVRGPYAP